MLNVDLARGFIPKYALHGGDLRTRVYYVPASDGTAIFIGDPVKFGGTADSRGVPTVTRATTDASDIVVGVVTGVIPMASTSMNLFQTHRPASTEAYVIVCDDPMAVFEIQANAAITAADISLNVDWDGSAGGSTVTGYSLIEADMATKATNNTLGLQIIGMANKPDNSIGTDTKVLVRINRHQYANQVAGA